MRLGGKSILGLVKDVMMVSHLRSNCGAAESTPSSDAHTGSHASSPETPNSGNQATLKAKLAGTYQRWEDARAHGDVKEMERCDRQARNIDRRIEE